MDSPPRRHRRWRRLFGVTISALVVLYLLLLIPDRYPPVPESTTSQAFLWNQDELWSLLEKQFKKARLAGCAGLTAEIDTSFVVIKQVLDKIAGDTLDPQAEEFKILENRIFRLAPMIAACTERLPEYLQAFTRLRGVVKHQSRRWDMNSPEARRCIYRLIYGGRAAVEEVMLQAPPDAVPSLVLAGQEPSPTPSADMLGVTVHSGDILVSRGGAPTSALIARGNDYPGNFSHVALVYVDEKTRDISLIESHIEKGVDVASLEEYLQDKKLRIMVLRLRADLPPLIADPLLPHKAACRALNEVRTRHISYDFEMDYHDYTKLFCSEVASAPYDELGITLWMGISTISSPGVRSWLAGFGVRYFETQEPSDLEYDPQLRVIAEWRDPETLYKDHVDNAVIDVMLEGADPRQGLHYPWYMLPVGRVFKGYSILWNWLGRIGPIPEGMSASSALRVHEFSENHNAIKARLLILASEFKRQSGYTPPYWTLVELARKAVEEVE